MVEGLSRLRGLTQDVPEEGEEIASGPPGRSWLFPSTPALPQPLRHSLKYISAKAAGTAGGDLIKPGFFPLPQHVCMCVCAYWGRGGWGTAPAST